MFYLLLLISFRENGSAAATRDLGFNQELTQSQPCSLQLSFPVNDPQKNHREWGGESSNCNQALGVFSDV